MRRWIILVVALTVIACLALLGVHMYNESKVPNRDITVLPTPQIIEVVVTPEPTPTPLPQRLTPPPKPEVNIVYVTLEPTEEPTPEPQIIYIEVTPEPTPQIIYVEVTPKPTDTPIPTLAPTPQIVYVEVTPEPTEVPRPTPTVTPQIVYIEITPEPTVAPEPTMEPTPQVVYVEVTPEPTEIPEVTPEPTDYVEVTPEPIEEPTVMPTMEIIIDETFEPVWPFDENDFEEIRTELSTLTNGGGVYPSYSSAPAYDLYNYMQVNDSSSEELFTCLSEQFVIIAGWTEMRFDEGLYGTDALKNALESSIDENCGRVIIREHGENSSAMEGVLSEIRNSGDFETANSMMLDYLYFYTIKNPNNPYERLILSCDD